MQKSISTEPKYKMHRCRQREL